MHDVEPGEQAAPSQGYDEASLRYAGWRVVFACFLLALSIFGFALYGQGVYLVELQRLHGWSASLISGASTLSLLIGNVIVIFTDEIVRRLGLKRLVFAGIACLAAAMVLVAFAVAPWQLYAAFALMSLGWVGMGTVIISSVVGAWFVARRGLAISLAFLGASSGGVVVTPLLVMLVTHAGFQTAMLIASAIMLAILFPVTLAWIARPSASGASIAQAVPASRISRTQLLRRLAFWTIAGPFAFGIAVQVGFIVHQIAMLQPKIGPVGAGFAVSVMTSMAIAGRLAVGMVADRVNPRIASMASLLSQALALLTIDLTDEPRLVVAASAVFGFSVGNVITLPTLIIHREFEAASFTVVMGLFAAITGIVGAFGPGLLGLVQGWTGDYGVALGLCISLDVIAAVIVVQGVRRG